MAVSSVRGPGAAPAPGPGRVPGAATSGAATLPVAAPARAATAVSIGAALLVVAVQVAVPGGWGALAWVPLVVGLLVGLPHGAVDHLVPAFRLGWRPVRLAVFALAYAVLAALAWLAFRAAPGPALAVFVLVSAWHFGSGETAFADLRAARPVRRDRFAGAVLGGVVLLLPLARATAATTDLRAALVPGWDGVLPAAVPVTVRAVVLAGAGVLGVVLLAGRRYLPAAELGVLLLLALVAPPLAAFGVYFGLWHSVRHLARVVAEDPANAEDLAAGSLARPLRRFAVAAALPTGAVLVVLALLWSAADGWRGFVVTDLPLLAALTVPHVLVVTWLDRAESR